MASKSQQAIPEDITTAKGGWSGGGGFRFKNSEAFLKMVSNEFADQILEMDPAVFSQFPSGKGQIEMANVIRSIRSNAEDTTPKSRPDSTGKPKELAFDYDKQGNFLIARRPYFEAYQFIPVEQILLDAKSIQKYELPDYFVHNVRELKHRLAHEYGHLLDLNEEDSEKFANALILKLGRNFIICKGKGTNLGFRRGSEIPFTVLIERTEPRAWLLEAHTPIDDLVAEGFRGESKEAISEWGPSEKVSRKHKLGNQKQLNFSWFARKKYAEQKIDESKVQIDLETGKGSFEFNRGKTLPHDSGPNDTKGTMECQSKVEPLSLNF